jgi:hypothetical protein
MKTNSLLFAEVCNILIHNNGRERSSGKTESHPAE